MRLVDVEANCVSWKGDGMLGIMDVDNGLTSGLYRTIRGGTPQTCGSRQS